jgi:hypothetical protein
MVSVTKSEASEKILRQKLEDCECLIGAKLTVHRLSFSISILVRLLRNGFTDAVSKVQDKLGRYRYPDIGIGP